MLTWMREKFGRIVLFGIIVFIGFVFVFSGVFTPKSTSGLHEGAVAGLVNGEAISLGEFNRELNQRLEFFKTLGGGTLNEAQIRAFRIREGVFGELVNRKLLAQAALESGMVASDEEVKARIMEMEVFQKDKRFDPELYKRVLAANQLSAGGFERRIREDLAVQNWTQFFRRRVRVSDDEVRREFEFSRDKRNIKYVVLTPAADKSGKLAEALPQLVDKVVAAMTASKASDSKVNALLKVYSIEVKYSGLSARSQILMAGAGESKTVLQDAFEGRLSVPRAYDAPGGKVVALVVESEKPDFAKFEQEKSQVRDQLLASKERELFDSYIKGLAAEAKVERNADVVGEVSPQT